MSTQVSFDPDDHAPVLHFVRRYPHSVDRVWAALTEPAQLGRWFPCEVEVDLRLGGTITLSFPGEEPDHAEITELDPPRTFAFLWAGERLRWTLEPDDDGCVLRLSNTVADRDWTAHTAAGWDRCLEALDRHLGGVDPGSVPGPDADLIAHYRAALPDIRAVD